jgi:hypothetical protein
MIQLYNVEVPFANFGNGLVSLFPPSLIIGLLKEILEIFPPKFRRPYCPCAEMGLGSKPKERHGLHPSFVTFFCCCENTASLFIYVDSQIPPMFRNPPPPSINICKHFWIMILTFQNYIILIDFSTNKIVGL